MRKASRPETPLPPPPQGPTTSTTEHREAEQLASEVLSEMAEGIATLAADRTVVSWNPHAERLTGYTLEQINAVGLVEIFEPRAVMDHLLREAHDGLTTFGERLRLRRRNGTLVHMHVQCSPVLHLVQNATEAMPQGGTLTLRGWRTATQIQLAIGDTGQGIAAEQLPMLFTPFQTTKPEGTGLGLYIVQEIVLTHGGTIEVASEPGRGTTMTITLPQTSSPQDSRDTGGKWRRLTGRIARQGPMLSSGSRSPTHGAHVTTRSSPAIGSRCCAASRRKIVFRLYDLGSRCGVSSRPCNGVETGAPGTARST